MTSATTEQPALERAKRYKYEVGTVRWLLLHNDAKPHRSGNGWRVEVIETNWHPTEFVELAQTQTWIKETYVGVRA